MISWSPHGVILRDPSDHRVFLLDLPIVTETKRNSTLRVALTPRRSSRPLPAAAVLPRNLVLSIRDLDRQSLSTPLPS